MADTSITAKFGLDAGPFNRGLSDVRQRLANLDKQAQDLNKTLGKLRSMMGMIAVASIAIQMLKSFFQSAIDRANEMEGSLNKNAEAVRNFSKTTEKLKKDLDDLGSTIAVNVVGSLNRVGEKMGDIIRIGINLGKGISIEQTIADIEAGVKAKEGELEGAEKLKEIEQRRADRIKQNASELANLQRANQSAQAETNRLIEQEAKLRDAAFLAGLSQEDLATELETRLKIVNQPDLSNVEIVELEGKIKALEVEDNDKGDDDRGQRLNELESARIRLAEIQAAQASKRLQQAELEIQLARVKAGIEEDAGKEKAKTDAANKKANDDQIKKINLLRQELTLAQEGVEKAKENEAQSRSNRLAPSIEEAAESGAGRVKRLAQSALRDEERAKEAFKRGNREEGERLGERALETRAKLSGIIQDSDSNPMKSVEENTKKSVEALQEILLQLTNAEADNSDE